MTIQVQLFALARQLAGAESVSLDLPPGATIRDARQALALRCPALSPLIPHLAFALDAQYAPDSTPIPPYADLACIPPVSGG